MQVDDSFCALLVIINRYDETLNCGRNARRLSSILPSVDSRWLSGANRITILNSFFKYDKLFKINLVI